MPETFEYRNKTQKYYSLGELTGSIRKVIAKAYTSAYWVKTEIAKLNFYPYSGHCYPDLVEKQNNKVVAQIRSTIWSGTFDAITKKFRQATGENLSEGMTVLFLVRVVYHEQHGLSLNILDVEPSFTLGEMAREKQQAIQRLKKEGLFDLNKQLAFPLLPKNIAVISVETSKGYHDFLNILQNNRYGYHFEQTLFPALLQGEGAVKSIVQQLKAIAHYTGRFDVVVIIRGGGGDVGLSAYNNYTLAKEVAGFPLPVITGIGHATNETVIGHLLGPGDLIDITDANIQQTDTGTYVYDYHSTPISYDSLMLEIGAAQGWRMTLTNGERVINRPLIIGGVVFFTTFVPNDDLCAFGGMSNLYGIDYRTGVPGETSILGMDENGWLYEFVEIGQGVPSAPAAHVGITDEAMITVQLSTGAIAQQGAAISSPKSKGLFWRGK